MKGKKAVSIVIVLIFTLISTTFVFASFSDIDNNPHREAIENMAELGILEGIGGDKYAPEIELNRASAAKVAAFLLGYNEEDANAAKDWEPLFNDVYKGVGAHEWALGWINLIASEEIILGYGDGKYHPGDKLTMVQWVTILTRILEHESEDMVWPDDYNDLADSLGLSNGLNYNDTAVVNRAQMARMTNTAIYDVEKPDGKKIIEIVQFKNQEQTKTKKGLEITADSNLVSASGEQTISVTAFVRDDEGIPQEGVNVEFFATQQQESIDRRDRLSKEEVLTDSEGKAQVEYMTHASDEDKQVQIIATCPMGDEWVQKREYIIASNSASTFEGVIVNPFNGEKYEDVEVEYLIMGTEYYLNFEELSNSDGEYVFSALTGDNTHIYLNLDLSDEGLYSGHYGGSHSEFFEDGRVRIRLQIDTKPNQQYALDSEMGILKGVLEGVSANSEIYVYDSNNTYIADTNEDGSFMIALPSSNYELSVQGGHIIKQNVQINKGEVTDTGNIIR